MNEYESCIFLSNVVQIACHGGAPYQSLDRYGRPWRSLLLRTARGERYEFPFYDIGRVAVPSVVNVILAPGFSRTFSEASIEVLSVMRTITLPRYPSNT